jgi:hypothetical protein
MVTRIAPIVEGHGDVLAVPLLIRRIAAELDPTAFVHVERPIRRPRYTLVRPGELEQAVEVAARIVGPPTLNRRPIPKACATPKSG